MVSTMDTLGLDIQQSVISCFNDFAMHASCSEAKKMVGVEARNRASPGNSGEQHRTARNMTGLLLFHMLSTLFSCIFRKM